MAGGGMAATVRLGSANAGADQEEYQDARAAAPEATVPEATEAMQKTLGELNGDLALSGTGNSVTRWLRSGQRRCERCWSTMA